MAGSPTRSRTPSSTRRCGCASRATGSSPCTCRLPGSPVIDDAHYPPRPDGPLARQPRATNPAEAEFLTIGEGARAWLVEAAAAGTSRVKVKMAEAVTLSRLHGTERIDWALGHAATFGRFADGDLVSILEANPPGQRRSADDAHSLQTGTAAWHRLGGEAQ